MSEECAWNINGMGLEGTGPRDPFLQFKIFFGKKEAKTETFEVHRSGDSNVAAKGTKYKVYLKTNAEGQRVIILRSQTDPVDHRFPMLYLVELQAHKGIYQGDNKANTLYFRTKYQR